VRTFEFRAPDPSANTYLLLAGIALAAEYGLRNSEKAVKIAENLNIEKTVKRSSGYKFLPLSCSESAKSLKRDRNHYQADGVFPKRVIDGIMSKLESYKDRELWKELADKPEKIEELLLKYFHSG